MELLSCPWETSYRFVAESVPPLLYYSHIPVAVLALLVGTFIYYKNRGSISSKLLFLIFILFTLWTILDLFLWANNRIEPAMIFWSTQILVEIVIYYTAFHLVYHMATGSFFGRRAITALSVLLVPLIFVIFPTRYNIDGFTTACAPQDNPFIVYYLYALEAFFIVAILDVLFSNIQKIREYAERVRVFYFTLGLVVFLFAFTSGNLIGSATGDWNTAQYGLFGMPVFIGFLTILMVKFSLFRFKIVSTQALVVTLWLSIIALLFTIQDEVPRILSVTILFLVTIFGFIHIQSVKKIEKLATNLKHANARLKVLDRMKSEFVAIASHQLRSPLTSIRGYASMLLEGSYGKLTKKVKEPIQRIADSSRYMALSVDDYLNVSRIEAGHITYDAKVFDLRELSEKIVDEMRPTALKKGLLMTFKSDCKGSCSVNTDVGKMRQILMNLIDNALKYTPKGQINVIAHDDVKKKKMYVSISDTGIGMDKSTREHLFDKFIRSKNASEVNETGIGLGLFVAKQMIRKMDGRIWAESKGTGKGSTFHIELPLLP